VRIRRLTADDVDSLRKIRLDALRTDPDAFGSTLEREEARPDKEWVGWLLSGSAMFVAENANEPIGLAGGIVDERRDDRAVLVSMWVAPNSRNQFVGRRLVSAVVDWARESGKGEVILRVVDGNLPALALYERCGFSLTGERVLRDRDQATELVMSRPLP
jgi:RimJ/RimL family protein N-acetyltransferase